MQFPDQYQNPLSNKVFCLPGFFPVGQFAPCSKDSFVISFLFLEGLSGLGQICTLWQY
jgi:hypothetical protein